MSKIGIIGATSFLGSYARDRLDAIAIQGRFEDSLETWQEYQLSSCILKPLLFLLVLAERQSKT